MMEPDRSVARRIVRRVRELRENPHRQVQRLVNSPCHRLWIGDYRVILDVKGATLRILVVKAGHRKSIYS